MSLRPAVRGRRVLAVVGLAAVLLAALLRVAPGVIPAVVRRPLTAFASTLPGEPILWVLAALAGFYALVRTARGRRRPAPSPAFGAGGGSGGDDGNDGGTGTTVTTGSERSLPGGTPPAGVPTVGTGFERAVSAAGEGAGDPRDAGRPVRERLRATATAVLARRTDASPADARAAVAAGEWTDDRVAAAFLGGGSAPAYELTERIRGWIRPGPTFRNRVERTVAAIEAVGEPGVVEESGAGGRSR